jgi:hypothetical protein
MAVLVGGKVSELVGRNENQLCISDGTSRLVNDSALNVVSGLSVRSTVEEAQQGRQDDQAKLQGVHVKCIISLPP